MLADEHDQVIRLPRWLALLPVLLLLASCNPCFGQVSVKSETLTKWHGFIAAKVLPDGVVVADPASKPFAKTETTYSLVVEPGFVLEDLAVEKKPILDFVTVEPGLITLPAGEYRATARLTKDGKPVTQRFNFTIGDVKPEPPKPDPEPDPVVDTIPKGSWLTFVEETSDRYKFPHLATIQADKAWYDGIKAKGLDVGWYDIDAKEVQPWASEAKKAGLPALLVIDPKGKVVKAKTVPPSTKTVDEFVFGGAK